MRILSKKSLAVVKAASTDETRYTLNSVKIEETEKGVRTVATNGRMLAMVESVSEFQPDDFPIIEGLSAAPNTATAALIHADSIKQVLKSMPKSGRRTQLPILNNVAVKLGETSSTFAMTNLETSNVIPVRNIDGHYPSYEQIIPQEMAFEMAVNPELLITVLEMAAQVAEEGNFVTIGFNSPLTPLKVTARRQGDTFTGVLMPMKGDSDLNDGHAKRLETLERVNKGLRTALKNLKKKVK